MTHNWMPLWIKAKSRRKVNPLLEEGDGPIFRLRQEHSVRARKEALEPTMPVSTEANPAEALGDRAWPSVCGHGRQPESQLPDTGGWSQGTEPRLFSPHCLACFTSES